MANDLETVERQLDELLEDVQEAQRVESKDEVL